MRMFCTFIAQGLQQPQFTVPPQFIPATTLQRTVHNLQYKFNKMQQAAATITACLLLHSNAEIRISLNKTLQEWTPTICISNRTDQATNPWADQLHCIIQSHDQLRPYAAHVCNYAANSAIHRTPQTHNLTDSLPSIVDTVTHPQNGDNKLKLEPDCPMQCGRGQASTCTGDQQPAASAAYHVTLIDRPPQSGAYHSTCCRLTKPWPVWRWPTV